MRTPPAPLLALGLASCLPNGPPTGLADAGAAQPAATVTVAAKKPRAAVSDKPPLAPNPLLAAAALDPLLTAPFADGFERGALGPDWRATGSAWKIQDGKLCAQKARNQGVWLARRLPTNVRVEFEATAQAENGDLKAEIFGDGASAATAQSYTNATSYLAIYGGWKNSIHALARLNEHGVDRLEVKVDPTEDDPRSRPVSAGQVYRFRVERTDGRTLTWWVDDTLMFQLKDPEPLAGPGHDHVGFNEWDIAVCFGNVKVTPLPG